MAAPRSVDEYLAAVPSRKRAALQKLRKTIASVAPDATEAISYQMPAFKDHGRSLVSYAAFQDHYSLFPMGTSAIEGHKAELKAYLSGKSAIHFSFDEPLPVRIVKLVVKARLAENAARRDAQGRERSTGRKTKARSLPR